MTPPTSAEHERAAREYLSRELRERAPTELAHVDTFDEPTLDGEGATTLFRFRLAPANATAACAAGNDEHYVVVGRTEPNYFPAYGLSPDEAYSLHVGTRFMLGMRVSRVDPQEEPAPARGALRAIAQNFNPRARVGEPRLLALFRCEEQRFGVYELEVDGEPVLCVGADCPVGFYTGRRLPPQVVLRLHLGALIRRESDRPADSRGA